MYCGNFVGFNRGNLVGSDPLHPIRRCDGCTSIVGGHHVAEVTAVLEPMPSLGDLEFILNRSSPSIFGRLIPGSATALQHGDTTKNPPALAAFQCTRVRESPKVLVIPPSHHIVGSVRRLGPRAFQRCSKRSLCPTASWHDPKNSRCTVDEHLSEAKQRVRSFSVENVQVVSICRRSD